MAGAVGRGGVDLPVTSLAVVTGGIMCPQFAKECPHLCPHMPPDAAKLFRTLAHFNSDVFRGEIKKPGR